MRIQKTPSLRTSPSSAVKPYQSCVSTPSCAAKITLAIKLQEAIIKLVESVVSREWLVVGPKATTEAPRTAWRAGYYPFVLFESFVVPEKTILSSAIRNPTSNVSRNSLIRPILSHREHDNPCNSRAYRKPRQTEPPNFVPKIVFQKRDKTPTEGVMNDE